jgi:hypothetical protein
MSPLEKQLSVSKWLPIVTEYDLLKSKKSQSFKTVLALLSAYHVTKRDLYKYHKRWVASGRKPQSLIQEKRGPRFKTRRTPKPIERQIIKAYRRLGAPSYEMVLLFKPYYGLSTPSARTIDRIKARYPLNPAEKEKIKRYEKKYPGELGHLDSYYLPMELAKDNKRQYLLALVDDCTRLCYAEVIPSLGAQHVQFFVSRAFSWVKQVYGFHFDHLMTDNGCEFKGTSDHPVEMLLSNLGVEHWYTPSMILNPTEK